MGTDQNCFGHCVMVTHQNCFPGGSCVVDTHLGLQFAQAFLSKYLWYILKYFLLFHKNKA